MSTKERPILFSGPMVRALPDGRKTQTRRVVKPQPPAWAERATFSEGGWGTAKVKPHWCFNDEYAFESFLLDCPYGKPGYRLWVREDHFRYGHWEEVPGVRTKKGRQKWAFVADTAEVLFEMPANCRLGRHHRDPHTSAWHKRLGRFMPRSMSRTLLEVVKVRVERLQEISEADAIAEGVDPLPGWYDPDTGMWVGSERAADDFQVDITSALTGGRAAYALLWRKLNGPGSWDENPWVWVVEFKVLSPSGEKMGPDAAGPYQEVRA